MQTLLLSHPIGLLGGAQESLGPELGITATSCNRPPPRLTLILQFFTTEPK